jgi:hypothetical protein
MRKNSKKKGNRGENQLVKILCEKFGDGEFKRTPSSGAYTGGLNRAKSENLPWEAKITLASDVITPANFNFTIEHKFYESIDFWHLFSDKSKWNEWINQAEDDATFINKEPLVVIKYNRHERIVLIRSPYLLSELKRLEVDINIPLFWKPANRGYGYAVVWLSDLLELPREFWFSGVN